MGKWACLRRVPLPLTMCRWDAEYEAVRLHELPHRVLTRPVKVHEYFFDGERKGRGRWAHSGCMKWGGIAWGKLGGRRLSLLPLLSASCGQ